MHPKVADNLIGSHIQTHTHTYTYICIYRDKAATEDMIWLCLVCNMINMILNRKHQDYICVKGEFFAKSKSPFKTWKQVKTRYYNVRHYILNYIYTNIFTNNKIVVRNDLKLTSPLAFRIGFPKMGLNTGGEWLIQTQQGQSFDKLQTPL